ncbi:MAG: manganese efflux pump [Alistipes sp.]|nr:manganese efflux pump [Alistipes sp.]
MTYLEIVIIAIGLAMDAFAVSVCKGLSVGRIRPKHAASVGLWFGGFQALMPLLGYALGISFADVVASIDHWIAFLLLGAIGANMVRESLSKGDVCHSPDFSAKSMFLMAVATSIDALAVGISFAFLGVNIFQAVATIGIITAILSVIGLKIGNLFGCRYKAKAEFVGGVVLVLMGLKILVEHTLLA